MSRASGSISVALNGEHADPSDRHWVHLLPAGSFNGRDGRGPWRVTSAARLIQETQRRQGGAIPVDYEHQTDYAPTNGQAAPAAGWIKGFQARSDGVWGLIEWTARAAEYLRAKEYRFISPTFAHTKGGDVTAILRAALTNAPNLELVALATARIPTGDDVDPIAQLRELLGLAAGAQVDAIIEAVRTLVEEKAQNRADPTKFVPIEVLEQVTAELNRVHHGVSEEAAVIAVDREIQGGKLIPALRDWGVSLCRVNKPAFDGFVTRTGAQLQMLFEPTKARGATPGHGSTAGAIETTIARQLGHSPEEMATSSMPKGYDR